MSNQPRPDAAPSAETAGPSVDVDEPVASGDHAEATHSQNDDAVHSTPSGSSMPSDSPTAPHPVTDAASEHGPSPALQRLRAAAVDASESTATANGTTTPQAPEVTETPSSQDEAQGGKTTQDDGTAPSDKTAVEENTAPGDDADADAATEQTTGGQKRLSAFFDSLDDRAREWWETRPERIERRRVAREERQKKNEEARKEKEEKNEVARQEKQKRDEKARQEREEKKEQAKQEKQERREKQEQAKQARAQRREEPPPPPPMPARRFRRRVMAEAPATPAGAVPAPATEQAFDYRLADSRIAAGRLPVFVAAPEPETPPAEDPPPPEAPFDQEATAAVPAPPEPEEEEVEDGPPAPPPERIRRALDKQRRRDLILQKAAAIESATEEEETELPYEDSADDEEDLYTYIPPYNLPSRGPDPKANAWDLLRRIYVSVGAVAAVITTMWMSGAFGTGPSILGGGGLQDELSDGWFSGDLALLSPDHLYYWIWPITAAGLVAHAVFQWGNTQASTPRQRRSGWLVGTASLLMLPATAGLHQGWVSLTLVSSVPMALLLLDAVRQFNLHTARTPAERRLTDGTVGLFFGFALVHAMSAISVWLTHYSWGIPGVPAILWAAAGLFICVWIAAYYAMTERGRITIALGLGWGMFWLVFPRLLSEVTSVWVAIGAAMGAFVVILATQSRRHRINHAERRAAMGRPLEDII